MITSKLGDHENVQIISAKKRKKKEEEEKKHSISTRTIKHGRNWITQQQKEHYVHGLGKSILWKWPYCQQQASAPVQISVKVPCHRSRKLILKLICEHKKPWIARVILGRNSNYGGVVAPGFKLYYRAAVTKSAWYSTETGTPVSVVEYRAQTQTHVAAATRL